MIQSRKYKESRAEKRDILKKIGFEPEINHLYWDCEYEKKVLIFKKAVSEVLKMFDSIPEKHRTGFIYGWYVKLNKGHPIDYKARRILFWNLTKQSLYKGIICFKKYYWIEYTGQNISEIWKELNITRSAVNFYKNAILFLLKWNYKRELYIKLLDWILDNDTEILKCKSDDNINF
jgi:hypothetical protein